jgi:hypothetical protein
LVVASSWGDHDVPAAAARAGLLYRLKHIAILPIVIGNSSTHERGRHTPSTKSSRTSVTALIQVWK